MPIIDTEQLADAMAAEFATSLPTDRAGWLEAARNVEERIDQAAPSGERAMD